MSRAKRFSIVSVAMNLKSASTGIVIAVLTANTAWAGDLCPALTDAMAAVSSNAPVMAEGGGQIVLPEADQCGTARSLSGGMTYHCYWEYPLRAGEAETHLVELQSEVESCLGVTPTEDVAPSVNHPDSNDVTMFVTPEATVAVSLKDKGALQKTLIFVRVTAEG